MAMSIGHIPGRCQPECKPLCFCSSGGIRSLEIEAAQVRLCNVAEMRMRGDACVKGAIHNDGYMERERLACTILNLNHGCMQKYKLAQQGSCLLFNTHQLTGCTNQCYYTSYTQV